MKRNKAKISGGLMTLKSVARSGLQERERERERAEPLSLETKERERERRRREEEIDGEICVWSKDQSMGGGYLEH